MPDVDPGGDMQQPYDATRAALRTPKAAAVAGIVFAVLFLAIFALLRTAMPADPLEPGVWLETERAPVSLALNLVPFAGIAFLWFVGMLRDRLGQKEDRFFATVFFGSSLLFLAMLFVSAAIIGALLLASLSMQPEELAHSSTFVIARATVYVLVNIYALKLAAVFLISTSTAVIFTGIAPRWMAILGYWLAAILLFGSYFNSWCLIALPIWVLLVSVHIVLDTFRRAP